MDLKELLEMLDSIIERTTTKGPDKVYRGDGVYVKLADEIQLLQEGRSVLESAVKSDVYTEGNNAELDEKVSELNHIIKILKGDLAPTY